MITRIYNIILIVFATALFAGCSEDKTVPVEEKTPIRLSSCTEICHYVTRAGSLTRAGATDFPNEGRIGVIATLYNPARQADWTAYSDLDNVPAIATNEVDDTYEFEWENGVKYWPFDETNLIFMAYSPYTDNGVSSPINLSADRKHLSIQLHDNMDDVLYSAGNANAELTPYNKHSEVVDLGEFQHALSQLTIQVIAGNNMNPDVRVTKIEVYTANGSGQLNIQDGEINVLENDLTYSLASDLVPFIPDSLSQTVLLFPGTEDRMRVNISLHIEGTEQRADLSYAMSSFNNITHNGEDLVLERGRNTILKLRISGVPVQEDDELNQLDGILSEWIYKGDFGITIQ